MAKRRWLTGVLALSVITGCTDAEKPIKDELPAASQQEDTGTTVEQPAPQQPEEEPLWETYRELNVVDAHSHDSPRYKRAKLSWDRYGIDRTVLFGNISEPSAIATDRFTWDVYRKNADRVIPFFAGFDMHEEQGLETVKENLELGFLGIGETVAASTHSPVTSRLEWKANHPMDGNLPAIYELCAEYGVPILLHIDPPTGAPIVRLAEALKKYPDTNFIFAHGNVFNSPDNLERLLSKYDNLYIDFYAGFSEHNPASAYETKDFVDLIEAYPDQFLLGTDSGYGIGGYKLAAEAIYELLDLLKPETREKVASGNFERLLNEQRPTETQRKRLEEAAKTAGVKVDIDSLSKHEANVKWFELTENDDVDKK